MNEINQYIHVQCEDYSLLIDILCIAEVINSSQEALSESLVQWRNKKMPFIDLTQILMGYKAKNNKHCLIMKENNHAKEFLGVGVGQVANIQAIKDEDFEDLPNLDFPFNEYFDKAYIPQKGGKCIYRLRNLVHLNQNKNDD